MDGKRFDELTRVMGTGASRRRVLKGLAAGVGGGLVALVGRRAPGAFAAGLGVTCASDTDCDPGLSCINDRCQECGPYTPEQTVFCDSGSYCDVSGANGVCVACNCAANEECAPINYTPDNQPVADICTCPNTVCSGACCAAGQVCDVAGACANPGELHSPCNADNTCNNGLYCIQGNCDVCSLTPDNPCPGGLMCDVTGYWAACRDLCAEGNVTCGDNETCNPGTGVCDCNVDLCQGACCATGDNCATSGCKAPSDLGGVCASNDPCATGLFCIPNSLNPENATDATAGFCEECNPVHVAEAVCADGSYCDVQGQFGVCKPCDCPSNDTCAPDNSAGDPCTCPNVTCNEVCCDAGLVCNPTAGCVQCNDLNDCASHQTCDANNMCVDVQCVLDSECDTANNEACIDNVCQCANMTCGTGSSSVCCAANEVCNAAGACAISCNADANCNAGDICDTKLGYCVPKPECTKDSDCKSGYHCSSNVCVQDSGDNSGGDTSGGDTSGGGDASSGGGDAVTSLPDTGIGGAGNSGSSWLGAAAIGGAAAFLAGKRLRLGTDSNDAE